jgi:hypothetical protein
MYTKSIIQQKVEVLQAKSSFKNSIETLMEKYNIEDSVFVFHNGALQEVVEGYFVTEQEYSNLDEAISNCDITSMGVRIIGNTFQIGKLHNKISECANDKKIFDLKRLEIVR